MKYLWMIFVLFLLGCSNKEDNIKAKAEIDKTTIRETYYLSTIVHDEHLFIISKRHGHFTHHPNCPCLTIKVEEKIEPKVEFPAGNILDLLKGNRP